MAISAQFLPVQICERLESELSEDIVALKYKWHKAADARHREIRPGNGGLKHVQQIFLSASFYKTEAMFVDSWHALSAAIRVAQELNMHRDSENCDIGEFERELRRQVWCSLYTWDRMMAFLFDRPPLIHRARIILIEPRPELHRDPMQPNLPSPLLSRILEFRLARVLDKYLDEDPSHINVKQLFSALKDIKDWLDSLPVIFRIRDHDITSDSQHPRIKHSKFVFYTTAYSCLFSVLKACLTDLEFPTGSSPAERERLRDACMEYCVRMTDVADQLTRGVTHSRFMLAFCLFETSATVCAAIVKDKQHKLPKRLDVSRALGRSKNVLDRLSSNTVVAKNSTKILDELLECLKTEQPETNRYVLEGQAMELDVDHNAPVSHTETGLHDVVEDTNALDRQVPGTDWSAANPDECTDFSSYTDGSFGDLDFTAIDHMWDWHNLDLTWSEPTGTEHL